jgi:uncharacterized protein (DUF2141 family)
MKKSLINLTPLFFLFTFLLSGIYPQEKTGTITIELDRIENQKGSIQVSLYNHEDGFPDDYKKAFFYKTYPITQDLKKIVLENIPFGSYAMAVLHDENDNFELDTNILGIPKEGYGFSNNVKGMFGPPSFNKAKFDMNEIESYLLIRLNY